MKRFAGILFGSTVANVLMVVGVVLLGFAVHLGVNPVDGSVVDSSVRDTWIPIFLFLAAAPAMAVMFVAGGGVIGFPLMYLAQIFAYWAVGRGVALFFRCVYPNRGSD